MSRRSPDSKRAKTPEADLSKVRTVPVSRRENKVSADEFAKAPGKDRSFAAFIASRAASAAS